jgi:hypothetical protein
MSHASRSAHIADLIDDLVDLYLAQVADLREFAQATEAGKAPCASKMPSATGKSAGPTSTGSSNWPPSPRPLFRWSPPTSSICPRITDVSLLPARFRQLPRLG